MLKELDCGCHFKTLLISFRRRSMYENPKIKKVKNEYMNLSLHGIRFIFKTHGSKYPSLQCVARLKMLNKYLTSGLKG